MFAFSAVVSHALGSVLTERMLGGAPSVPNQRLTLLKGMLAEAPRGSYPRIAAVSSRFDRWTFDRVFEVGLHSLVSGLHDSGPRRAAHRSARS
ncbi:MAG: TetR/AcrR family transcriptional regulator C-terminal domain-containing protein [Polyangiaceae bacterium]